MIRPPHRWPSLDIGALVRSRELLVMFARREVKLRYRQTVLGAAWIILAPALTAAVFSFVFSSIARLPSEHVPYFLFALVGMAGWTAFSTGLARSGQSLVNNASLVTKIYFERLTLILGTVLAALVDLGIVLVIVGLAMAAYQVAPGVALLALPVWLAGLLATSTGLGLIAGSLMVRYRDVSPLVTLGTQILLYVSPVAYGATVVPGRLRPIFDINPLVGLIDGMRWSILGTARPGPGAAIYSLVFAGVITFVGLAVFRRQERSFADVI